MCSFAHRGILKQTLRLLGISGLAITIATPAQARCLVNGEIRFDVEDSDCEEA
jgi:hypothetical protein